MVHFAKKIRGVNSVGVLRFSEAIHYYLASDMHRYEFQEYATNQYGHWSGTPCEFNGRVKFE